MLAGSQEASPTQEPIKPRILTTEKKKKYKVEALSKLKSMIPKDVKKWFMDATIWAQRYKDEFENEQELVLHLFILMEGEVGDWVFPFLGKLLTEPRTAPMHTLRQFAGGLLGTFGDPDAERA
ncbi:hypothetical protein FRC11_009832, partial [Ceratobasidium sp. 423]